jgi:hypothetical protein
MGSEAPSDASGNRVPVATEERAEVDDQGGGCLALLFMIVLLPFIQH